MTGLGLGRSGAGGGGRRLGLAGCRGAASGVLAIVMIQSSLLLGHEEVIHYAFHGVLGGR